MMPNESKQLIEYLAKGIDPITGEVLPKESPYNNPDIIRALFLAVKALEYLERREQRERSLPSLAGKPWSEGEDQGLIEEFDAGIKVAVIASKHQRTEEAINSCLAKLGKV